MRRPRAKERPPIVRIPELEDQILALRESLMAFALSLTKTKANAEDLFQDTYVKALCGQHMFERGSNLKAWLFTIMRNEWYSKLRKVKRERPLDDAIIATTPARREDIEFEEQQDVRGRFLKAVPFLAALPRDQLDSMVAVHYLEFSYEVTAELFETNIGTIKSRVSRGLSTVAGMLATAEVRSYDISAWSTATLHVPRHHPYFCIAEAYEEIYAFVHTHAQSLHTQFNAQPTKQEESEVDTLYREMLESGVLDDEFELEDVRYGGE